MSSGNRFNGLIVLYILIGLVYGMGQARAEENIDNFALSPEQLLDAKVMSASKTSEKLLDAPAAIYVLSNEDIMRSGATSIPEALRIVPGVQVTRINANSWAISVRGFNSTISDKLLVLIDGRQVYDPLYSGVYWDVQDTMLEDVDRIEVIRGPGASLWGANAVNGVINVITKTAKNTQGDLASVALGNQDRSIVEERHGGKLGDDGYWRVYGKYLQRDDGKTPQRADAYDGMTADRGGFRADWKGNDTARDNFTVQGDMYNNDTSSLTNVSTFTPPYSQTQVQNITARGGNLLGRWNRTLSDDSRVTVQSYVDYTARDQLSLGYQRTTFDLDTQYELPSWNRHKVIVGGEYNYAGDQLATTQFVTIPGTTIDIQNISGFIQDKITLEPKTWFLTLGTKLERNDYTKFEVEPNASLQWHPDEKQMVWTSVSRAVRTPSQIEHDLTLTAGIFPFGGGLAEYQLVPNKAFNSETLVAYEVGYRNQLTPKLMLDVTGFYNDYNKLSAIAFLSPNLSVSPAIFPLIINNDGIGETHGIETLLEWRAHDTLNLSTSYSLLDAHLRNPAGETPVTSQGSSPEHQFNARALWDITKNTEFDTTLYYVSSLPSYNVDHYWRFDVHWGWRIINGVQFDLVGQNLFDGSHREFLTPTSVNTTEITPSIYGKLTWHF